MISKPMKTHPNGLFSWLLCVLAVAVLQCVHLASGQRTTSPVCDCSGRPSWGTFAGSLVGVCIGTIFICFACLQCALGCRESKEAKVVKRTRSQIREEQFKDRQRGFGAQISQADDAERAVESIHNPLTTRGNRGHALPQPDGREVGEFILAPPKAAVTLKASPNMRQFSTQLSNGSPASTPRGSRPTTPVIAQRNVYRGPSGESDGSRPNSAVGTPDSTRAGRVGFSKQRKSERKAFLASNEFLGGLTPPGGSPLSTLRPGKAPPTPSPMLARRSPKPTRRNDDADNASEHIVIRNKTATQDDDDTSEASLSVSYEGISPDRNVGAGTVLVEPEVTPTAHVIDQLLEKADNNLILANMEAERDLDSADEDSADEGIVERSGTVTSGSRSSEPASPSQEEVFSSPSPRSDEAAETENVKQPTDPEEWPADHTSPVPSFQQRPSDLQIQLDES